MKKTLKLGHVKLGEWAPCKNIHMDHSSDTFPVCAESMVEFPPVGLSDLVIFWIEKQSHRGDEFGSMNCQCGSFSLMSGDRPDWDYLDKTLWVQGWDDKYDNRKLLCTLDEWDRIQAAVAEYNSKEW